MPLILLKIILSFHDKLDQSAEITPIIILAHAKETYLFMFYFEVNLLYSKISIFNVYVYVGRLQL